MRKLVTLLLLAGALNVNAAEILAEVTDGEMGYANFSTMTAGGPIAAVAGAVVGAFGAEDVRAARSQNRAYMVRTDSGEVRRFRAESHEFAVGDQVKVVRGRLQPVNDV